MPSHPHHTIATPEAFLAPGGEMGQLMRQLDWSQTPLGPPSSWSESLRTAVNVLLSSRYDMWMGWGDSLTFLYNDAYRATLGLKHPWALGKPAAEVWAEIWPDLSPRIQVVLSTGEATYDEGLLLFLERSGFTEETYHTFSYSPLYDAEGAVRGMLCVVTEDTSRLIAERRMATLRDLASALSSAASESATIDAVTRHLNANSKDLPFTLTYLYSANGEALLAGSTGVPAGDPIAPERIVAATDFPWPAAELLSHPELSQSVRLSDRFRSQHLPQGAWSKCPDLAAVVPIRQQGSERPAGFLVAGLNPFRRYDESYSSFVGLIAGQIAAGLSNARVYEEERRRAEALAELDRAKTVFFSNVSHEFRTPLTLMLGPLEDLRSSPEIAALPETSSVVEMIQRNGLRLQRLVNALLDFSRIEAGRANARYEPVDLAGSTAELASNFRSLMERAKLDFEVDAPQLPQPVYVDREMWEKVVLNLVSNAFKYTLSGSVKVSVHERAGQASVTVADTGVGISAEELPRVFERFHRAGQGHGRTHEGTGIGLALVHELVKLHGGTITAESVLGQGSTFTVSLPFGSAHLPAERIGAPADATEGIRNSGFVEEALRWLPDATAAADTPQTRVEHPSQAVRRRVLLADDNADMRDYLQRLLSTEYEVALAPDGREALAIALANPPDLVLSDVMMPRLDGFGLLSALRAHPSTRSLPVLLLSARAGEDASIEGLSAGADDYLVKPFSARDLLARVSAQLALRDARGRVNERLNQIFQQAPVGIVVFRGADFIVELANPPYQRLLAGRNLVGRPFAEVVPELDATVWSTLRSVLETGRPFVADELYSPYDGDGDGASEDHWFNVAYHPLEEKGGEVSGVIAVVNEVTSQVLARKELERANVELEEFAYVASHDLQEPLRAVNIYSGLLLDRVLAEDARANEYAGFVSQGVRRMEELIKDLLLYSRTIHPDQDPPQPVSLDAALDDALEVLAVRAKESDAIFSRSPLPEVLGDRPQLSLVFQNLLSNSLKYQPPGRKPIIDISAQPGNGQWAVEVRDNGIGFLPTYSERVFGLFKRLHKEAYPGTGLGLAICKRIVERYGGTISAYSAGDDQGATFKFSLPRA